ncbi:MAG TPA: gamma carbonic anhydrase family protein [Acidimicrobiales bacterium]|jgi:carbonic anhydrase/acetyltransferase-like protein (isoleucine patch superfamily)
MPIYALGERTPTIHPDAFVHPDAVVIGDVTVGARSSLWPCAVLRGDYGAIVVGEETSIQDGAVVHAVPMYPTVIGSRCVIGHNAHLEGCTLEDETLAGSGSVILHQAVIRTGATVGANAVVPNGLEVPAGSLALGVPARIHYERSNVALIKASAAQYVANAQRFGEELRLLS